MKHTKGPWKTYGGAVWSDSKDLNLSERTNRICVIGANLRAPESEKLANAQLIATAPELLEECKAALDYLESFKSPSCRSLKLTLGKAITKAEGSSK